MMITRRLPKSGLKTAAVRIGEMSKLSPAVMFIFLMMLCAVPASLHAQATDEPAITDEMALQAEPLSGIRLGIGIESGAFWFSRNEARIPGDSGTTFDLTELTGTGAQAYLRLNLNIGFGERHTLRLLFVPLSQSGTGRLSEPVFFENSEFASALPTQGNYRFNTYRATYRYDFYRDSRWEIGAGAALLVRDAKIELTQGELRESNTDLGLVPLLHFRTAAAVTDRLTAVLDAEGLLAPQGRAFDVSLQADYRLSDSFSLFAGYRFLDGGADTDDVYTFAWVNYLLGGIRFGF